MRRVVVAIVVALLGSCAGLASAADAPAPGTGPAAPVAPPAAAPPAAGGRPSAPTWMPPAPEPAADAVLAALAAKDEAALKALAAKDDPDPWIVADELVRRGQLDAADAFARAAPRADTEALPAYVASRRGKPDDPARRDRLTRSFAAGSAADALAALGPEAAEPIDDVVAIRTALERATLLLADRRPRDVERVAASGVEAARRIGWLVGEHQLLFFRAQAAARAGRRAIARAAFERQVAINERRGDALEVAAALGNVGRIFAREGDFDRALDYLDRSRRAHEALGERAKAAAALAEIGSLRTERGDPRGARTDLEQAVAILEATGDERSLAAALEHLGIVFRVLGEYGRALECYRRALAIVERVKDWGGVASLLLNVGNVSSDQGDFGAARSALERALELYERLGDAGGTASARGNLGVVALRSGDFAGALALLDRALAAHEALGQRLGAAQTLNNLGLVHQRRGELAKAQSCYERSLEAYRALGFRDGEGVSAPVLNLGSIHAALGDLTRAIAFQERALEAARAAGNRAGALRALNDLGVSYDAQGDYRRALEVSEQAYREASAIGDQAGAALALGNVGLAHRRLGDLDRAAETYARAIRAHEALGSRFDSGRVRSSLGILHLERGDLAAALDEARRALAAAEDVEARREQAFALALLAHVQARTGDPRAALASARRAVRLAEASVRGFGAEESASARGFRADAVEIGVQAAAAVADARELAWFVEGGRAGSLLEGLAARDALAEAAIPLPLRTAEAEARAAEAAAAGSLRRAVESGDLAAVRAGRASLERARERLSSTVARIQREAKSAAALVHPEVSTLEEIASTLAPTDAVVLYAPIAEDTCFALVVTAQGHRVVSLGPTERVEAAAEALALDDPDADPREGLTRLATLVVAPLGLGAGTTRVLVSPAGALSYVPFAALLPDRTVAYVPSGTTYRLLREEEGLRGEGVLALGDPDYATKVDARALAAHRGTVGKLVRLPATRDEALAIGTTTLLGADATEAGLRKALAARKRWRAVHLACHGLVNTERPALSSLAVTAAGDDDGFLTCLDVFRMKVPADLVVLSACETGKGKVVKGEGIVGLTRAFMFAGSPRVLCSLWKVDDEATSALMTKFYELWNPKTGSKGMGTAEALRAAQEHLRSQEKWKHPYYWAAWVLWGLPS